MLLSGEGTKDQFLYDNDEHVDDGDGYGGSGQLLASEPGKAVSAERHHRRRVQVQTIVNVFIVPGLVPKGLEKR